MSKEFMIERKGKPSVKDLIINDGYVAIDARELSGIVDTGNGFKSRCEVQLTGSDFAEKGDVVFFSGPIHPIGIECKEYKVAIVHESSIVAVARSKSNVEA